MSASSSVCTACETGLAEERTHPSRPHTWSTVPLWLATGCGSTLDDWGSPRCGALNAHDTIAPRLSGTQIRPDDQLAVPDVARPKRWPDGARSRQSSGACKPLDVSRIHAATGNGEREYSRRSPPSLSSHVTGPDMRTGSERAIGVCRSSPRCGRAWL